MMVVTQNSIEAYNDLRYGGELGKSQKEILDFIRKHPNCSYNDIARVLHLHHNTVTARIKELRNEGHIICSGTKVDEFTHKSNNVYRVRREGENPDVIVNDAIPTIPRGIAEFIKKAVKGQIYAGELETVKNNIRYKVRMISSMGADLEYGDFVKLKGINIACEDNAHNVLVLGGTGFTVKFRIN